MLLNTDWMDLGICSNQPELNHLFFSADPVRIEKAKQLCQQCEVRAQCEDYGNRTRSIGIWGGFDENQRSYRELRTLQVKHQACEQRSKPHEPKHLESAVLVSLSHTFDLTIRIQQAS